MYNLHQLLNPDFKVQPEMNQKMLKEYRQGQLYTVDNVVDRIWEMLIGITLTQTQANRLHSRIQMVTEKGEGMSTGKQILIEGLDESEKQQVQEHLLKESIVLAENTEWRYRKIVKSLLIAKQIGYKDTVAKKVFAVYGGPGDKFITNIEASSKEEALEKAVDELVKISVYV